MSDAAYNAACTTLDEWTQAAKAWLARQEANAAAWGAPQGVGRIPGMDAAGNPVGQRSATTAPAADQPDVEWPGYGEQCADTEGDALVSVERQRLIYWVDRAN